MKIETFPEVPPECGIANLVAVLDWFCRNFFAYPTASQDAKTVAKIIFNIMTEHVYLPMKISSDKGSVFVSQVIEEITDVPGITLEHGTTKHAQRTGKPERTHSSLKKALMIKTGGRTKVNVA